MQALMPVIPEITHTRTTQPEGNGPRLRTVRRPAVDFEHTQGYYERYCQRMSCNAILLVESSTKGGSQDQRQRKAPIAVEKVSEWIRSLRPECFREYWQTIKPTRTLLGDADENLEELWSDVNEAVEDGKPRFWKGGCHLVLYWESSDSVIAVDSSP